MWLIVDDMMLAVAATCVVLDCTEQSINTSRGEYASKKYFYKEKNSRDFNFFTCVSKSGGMKVDG